MNFQTFGRLAGAITIAIGLSGCLDMTMDLELLSETAGKSTVTSVMGADIYPMVKAGASGESSGEGFCEEENSVLTENADGSATCVQVTEGTFAEIMEDEEDGISFTVVSPGVVRVALATEKMKGDLAASTGGEEAMDEETKAMMATFFEGHTITMRFRGREVTDTNMTVSADGTTAEQVIPFLDLINGTVELPDELYAVIRVN